MTKKQNTWIPSLTTALRYLIPLIGYPIAILTSYYADLEKILRNTNLPRWTDFAQPVAVITFFALFIYWLYSTVAGEIYRLVMPRRNTNDGETRRIANAIALIIFLGILVMCSLLAVNFIGHARAKNIDFATLIDWEKFPSKTIGEFLGTFGDFFGGVINPVLTFFTFIALTITMVMQRLQLKETGELSRLQTFETTFFNLLNLYNTTVQDLRYEPALVTTAHLHNGISNIPANGNFSSINSIQRGTQVSANPIRTPLKMRRIKRLVYEGREVFAAVLHSLNNNLLGSNIEPVDSYKEIQTAHNYVLGRYFRNLYQILEFIDGYASRFADEPNSDELPGKRYSDIVRAQLSSSEILLLFYNCHSNMVDNGEFRELIKKYELLEHMSLKFLSSTQLGVPGYAHDITPLVSQYLYIDDSGKIDSPGAFGKNPIIEDYLINNFNYAPVVTIKKVLHIITPTSA